MPTPNPDEVRSAFMARCIPAVIRDGTAINARRATEVCTTMWNGRKTAKSPPSGVLGGVDLDREITMLEDSILTP